MYRARTDVRGFTLLELLVALAVVVIVATAVTALAPMSSSLSAHKTKADALVHDLAAMRSTAIRTGQVVRMTVAPDGAHYKTGDHVETLEPPHRITADTEVMFFPDGTASSSTLSLTSGPYESSVRVDALLGVARVADHE